MVVVRCPLKAITKGYPTKETRLNCVFGFTRIASIELALRLMKAEAPT